MKGEPVRQTTFYAGEVDAVNWKRTDRVESYLAAAQSLKNMEVGTTGLTRKRKGMLNTLTTSDMASTSSRLFPFNDKNGQAYLVIAVDMAFNIFSWDGSDFTFYQTVANSYSAANIQFLDYAQNNDVLVFSIGSVIPSRLYVSSYGPVVFSFAALNIYPYPAYDFGNINYNGFTVALSVSGSVLTFTFTTGASDPGFTNAWVGGQIIGGGATDIEPIGYAIITGVGAWNSGTHQVSFTAAIQVPFLTSGYSTAGSQYSVRQPAWSNDLGWPAKVLFYQNRLWFANSQSLNNTIFGSQINEPINFDVGTGIDTDAIISTIGQTDSGGIVWLNGGKQLEIYTQNFEFVCPQDQNSALTPSTFSIRQQSAQGTSPILKPITYLNDSYFVAKTGKSIVNYHFNGVGLAYVSTNISAASQHLAKNPTNRALLRGDDLTQDNFIYFLNKTDNTLTAFQFAPEQNLAALTPVVFQDDVELVDICTLNNQVMTLKHYTLTDVYTVEQMTHDVHIDNAQPNTMDSDGLVSGLDDLIGYTVQVVFDNQDFGEYVVDDAGEIHVENFNHDSGDVTIGLLYDNEVIPMYIFAGANASPFYKSVNMIYVDYFESLDFNINGKLVPYQYYDDIQNGIPIHPRTDTAIVAPIPGFYRFSTLAITQHSPFDLQITSIEYQVISKVI